MKILRGRFIFLWGLISVLFFLPIRILAFCPMCVIATGTFLGIFRWLGVDDTIIGLWLGGFLLSSSIVFNKFLIKKWKAGKFRLLFIVFVFYGLIVLSLYKFGGLSPYNKIFGVYKIFFGMIIGSLLLLFSPYLDKFLRKHNQGKILVSHQKMIIAVGLLIIFSLILSFIL